MFRSKYIIIKKITHSCRKRDYVHKYKHPVVINTNNRKTIIIIYRNKYTYSNAKAIIVEPTKYTQYSGKQLTLGTRTGGQAVAYRDTWSVPIIIISGNHVEWGISRKEQEFG